MAEAPRGTDPEASQSALTSAPTSDLRTAPKTAAPIAVATDVGAWRVVWPVLHELERRGEPCRIMLADPSARVATADGVPQRTMTNRLTWVLIRHGHDWRIVHEHTSAPIDESNEVILER